MPAVALHDLHAVCSNSRAPPPAGCALREVHYDRRPPRAPTPATALCEIHAVTSLRELQRWLHPHHLPHQWCPPHLLQWMSPGMVAHIGDRRIWKRPCASCSRRCTCTACSHTLRLNFLPFRVTVPWSVASSIHVAPSWLLLVCIRPFQSHYKRTPGLHTLGGDSKIYRL
ncbi:hypothetical protein EJB05_44753, partial [Eragrostis curvula]